MTLRLYQAHGQEPRLADRGLVKAIVFEPAGVVYDPTPRRRWLWQLVMRVGVRISYDEFAERWATEFLPLVHCGQRPYAEALHAYLVSLGLSSADLSEVEAAMPIRGRPLETGVRPLPGVIRVLNRLSAQGYALAALSDCSLPGTELKEKFDDLGLSGHFGTVMTSADLGSVKPSAENYAAITATLKLQPSECVMVSTHCGDLAGARSCDWRTIALGTLADAEVDATILSVGQLIEVVSDWTAEKLSVAS